MSASPLSALAHAVESLPDPRSQQGVSHPYHGMLTLVLLGLVAAVDGKAAKQMKDANGDPPLMLNIFLHNVKVSLMSHSVRGDKTNEPGCLKGHLESLFEQYPLQKLLTGDAIFAQRPLLEVLQEHDCDYLFQIKDNQPDILDAAKTCFAEVDPKEPDGAELKKRGAMSKSTKSGAIVTMPSMSVSG